MAVLIMFNNFLHDLATGIWFSSMFITMLLTRWSRRENNASVNSFWQKYLPVLLNINLLSLGLVFIFGIGRAITYNDFEYVAAAGKGQVTALLVKHVLLFGLAAAGIYWQLKMRFKLKRERGAVTWPK